MQFLTDFALNGGDFNEKTEFLIDGFLPKRLITLIYADGGSGKSWVGMAIAKRCAMTGSKVVYLDFDNPLTVLKARGIHDKLVGLRGLQYVQRSKVNVGSFEFLLSIEEKAVGSALNGYVFIIDSLRNFADIGADSRVSRVMEAFMNLRDAGATVVVLHHSNKDGKNYQGSNHIRNSVDNMYQLSKIDAGNNEVGCLLMVKKERASISDKAFAVSVDGFSMREMDVTQAQMAAEEMAFVQQVEAALQEQCNLNKTELLEAVGKAKDDKTARALLDKFDGVFWQSKKEGIAFCYRLLQQEQH